jgi:hypothetical protein
LTALALAPIDQARDHERPMPLAAAARNREDARHLAAVPQRLYDPLDRVHLGVSVTHRGTLRGGDRDEEDAAVLGWHQLLRQGTVEHERAGPDRKRHEQDQKRGIQAAPKQQAVASGCGGEAALN